MTTRYLTTDDLAEATGKTRDYWARLCAAGTIRGVKLGNDWRVAEDVFEVFMRGGTQATARTRTNSRQRRSA